jgi:catechol 2,3-dioxygenase-like lactoylglutathione lyase family enzyme
VSSFLLWDGRTIKLLICPIFPGRSVSGARLCQAFWDWLSSMKMARLILFTGQMDAMSRFYGEVLGLKRATKDDGWQEFAAGGARIALHPGPSSPGRKGPKIVFHAEDVAALRETLVGRGASFGKVREGEFCLCDGKDPDGNPIQLSNR